MYYSNKIFHDAEIRYTKLKKLIFALVITAKKLQPYFQVHTIVLLMDQPIKAVLHHLDTSGRIAKWALQLFEFDIKFHSGPSIKAQVLVDFILKCTIPNEESSETAESSSMALKKQINIDLDPENQ